MLAKFPEAIEADLQEYYRLDLADLYRGELTPRKVAVMVFQLPRGARLWQCVGGQGAITAVEEALWIVQYLQQARLYQAGEGKGPKPELPDYPAGHGKKKSQVDRLEANARAFREKFGKKTT